MLPLAWTAQRFSFHGMHFDARDVIIQPKPTQDPIPIWIGGNSKLTRRRVAARAQGWMPFQVSGEMAKTTRTPALEGLSDVRDQIAEVREQAGERASEIEIALAYNDLTIHQPTVDVARHRDAFAELAAIGVDWIAVTAEPGAPSALIEFTEAFGESYCR